MATNVRHKEEKLVSLQELCKKSRVSPRSARRRLRNAGEKVPQPKGYRWEWPQSKVKAVLPYIRD